MTTQPTWIAADWGTSHLRLWLMGADDTPLRRIDSDRGMGKLSSGDYEPLLLSLLEGHLSDAPMPVVICGMAGAKQGWVEAPYAAVPCEPPVEGIEVPTQDPRLQVRILPGLKQPSPPDVMRGEETQIGGYLATDPDFDGILCLPGTHNKWAHISAKEVVSFRTFMTGELFALLSSQSVLRHSVTGDGWGDAAFAEAVSDIMSKPAILTSALFGLRADSLLNGTPPARARARLSGLLIGAELSAARPYWLGQQVVILGEDALARAYQSALAAQGAAARIVSAEDITLKGLTAAMARIRNR